MATNVYLASALTPDGEKRVSFYCDIDTNTFYWSDDDGNIEEFGQEDEIDDVVADLATATASIATNEDDIDTLEGYFSGASTEEIVTAVGGTFSFTNGVLTGYIAP